MSKQRVLGRRRFLTIGLAGAGAVVLAACQQAPAAVQTQAPQVVERVVTQVIEKPVEVTRVVQEQVEVTRVVQEEVQVTQVVEVTSAAQSTAPVEIIFESDWIAHEGGERPKVMERALDLWHENNTPRIIGRFADTCRLDKLIASQTLGDAILGCGNTLKQYADAGIFQDITAELQAKNVDWEDFIPHEDFYVVNGKHIGMPFQFNLFDMVANKTLIENAGLELPDRSNWTYDDMLNIATQVTNTEQNIWGKEMRWGIGSAEDWFTAIYAFGGDIMSEDGTKSLLAEPAAKDALQMVYDRIHKWKIQPLNAQIEELGIEYTKGNYAFGWGIARGLEEEFESVQMMPPKNATTGLGFSLLNAQPNFVTTMAAARGVVEPAVDFVIFMAGKEVQQIILEEGGSAPMRLSSFESDKFAPAETREILLESNKVRANMRFHRTRHWVPWWAATTAPLQKALDGEISLNEAIAQAVEMGDQALAGEEMPTG